MSTEDAREWINEEREDWLHAARDILASEDRDGTIETLANNLALAYEDHCIEHGGSEEQAKQAIEDVDWLELARELVSALED